MSAKQVIVLDLSNQEPGLLYVRTVFWIPISKPVPLNTTVVSAYKNASAAEIASIQNGTVIEKVYSLPFPDNLPNATIQTLLIQFYQRITNALGGQIPPGNYYGLNYDGVIWVQP